MAKNVLRGIIGAVLEPSPPADVRGLQKRVPNAGQRQHAAELLAEFQELRGMRDDWAIPLRRMEVVLRYHRIKSLDELDRQAMIHAQKAAVEHEPRALLTYDSWFNGKMEEVATKAKRLIVAWNDALVPHIADEIENFVTRAQPLFEPYGCDARNSEPVARLTEAMERARDAARGEWYLGPWQSESQLNEWL